MQSCKNYYSSGCFRFSKVLIVHPFLGHPFLGHSISQYHRPSVTATLSTGIFLLLLGSRSSAPHYYYIPHYYYTSINTIPRTARHPFPLHPITSIFHITYRNPISTTAPLPLLPITYPLSITPLYLQYQYTTFLIHHKI